MRISKFISYRARLPIRCRSNHITGNVLAAAAAEDQTTLQFHANLDMLTNGGGGAHGANNQNAPRTKGGGDESQNGPDSRQSPLKDIVAKVRLESYFYE